jgi:hypothetical protein
VLDRGFVQLVIELKVVELGAVELELLDLNVF